MPTRIPPNIPGFNTYVNNTDTYLVAGAPVTNGERLGLTPQNLTDWNAQRVNWRDTLYPKYSDPLQSTSAVKAQVHNFMEDFRTFAQPLLNVMAASPNATEDDEAVFNFTIGHAAPVHHTTPIADGVVFEAKPIGGGDLHFSCRTAHDDHRASKAEEADSVQLAYEITDLRNNNNNGGGTPTPPGPDRPGEERDNRIPTPADKGMTKEIFTKSQFTFHAGAENVGKRLVAFMRWYNTKHPELAGPWTAITVVVIA